MFNSISPEFNNFSIICTAPSKTFNLAGLQVSNLFIPNPELKSKFSHEIERAGYSQLNSMGLIASQAAYEYGENWLEALKIYLQDNLSLAQNYFQDRLKPLKLVETEGTYLLWIDFKELGLPDKEINELVINKAGLWLDEGLMFGKVGAGFQRINMACPRIVLTEALNRLEKALKS
jgi:cystathionine beta-lyase